jgi:hypothetical protein
LFEGITFKVAEGPERVRSLEWRKQIYKSELGHEGLDRFDAFAHQLIAVDSSGQLLAGIRIQGPEQRPLEIEEFVDLTSVTGPHAAPGQIGGFWVRPDDRFTARKHLLPMGMLKLAVVFALRRSITDLVMRTPVERLRAFYKRGFFRALDELNFDHPVWGRVFVMHLGLVDFQQRHRGSQDPIARFLLDDGGLNITI